MRTWGVVLGAIVPSLAEWALTGRVQVLGFGTDGRLSDLSVTASSGSSALDTATCNILKRRARFTPAKDMSGNPISDTFSQRIRWELPED